MDGYVYEINGLSAEIKRLVVRTKELRNFKKKAEQNLFELMDKSGMDEYGGIKKEKIKPKIVTKRKGIKQKKNDAIQLFYQIGVPNPEELWVEFIKTQKIEPLS